MLDQTGALEEQEKEMLDEYCLEMNIQMPTKTIKYDYIIDSYSDNMSDYKNRIEEIFNDFGNYELKIVYFELIALMYADGVITDVEQDILKRLEYKMFITAKYIDVLKNCAVGIMNGLKTLKSIENLHNETKE